MVKDSVKVAKALAVQQNAEIDQLARKLSDAENLIKVHETKLAKFTDEKVINEKSRGQLRRDIKEFENLVKDVTFQTNCKIIDLKHENKQDLLKF